MVNKTIPIVFTFDDNYTLPAAVAMKSLVKNWYHNTQYEIYCLFQNLSDKNRSKLDKLVDVHRVKVDDDMFWNVPATEEYPIDVYYRLAIHDILTKYDRIIYSDVDVLFQKDLSESYEMCLENKYRAWVPLEKNETVDPLLLTQQLWNKNDQSYMSGHTKFEQNSNELIFASWYMVINAQKMRQDNMTKKFLETIKEFSGHLKMFDLEVLNLACQKDTIASLPLSYCLFEDLVWKKNYKDTTLYPFLSRVFSDTELQSAIQDPKILHYTWSNNTRVWNRPEYIQPTLYRNYYNQVMPYLV